MIQRFSSEYYHESREEIWMSMGKQKLTAVFMDEDNITVTTQVLLEVRENTEHQKLSTDSYKRIHSYDAIAHKLGTGHYGSMRTMQSICIEIGQQHYGVEVDFYCQVTDNRRQIVRPKNTKKDLPIEHGEDIIRKFWVEIRNNTAKLRERFPHRANPGVVGEKANARGATVGVLKTRPKRRRTVESIFPVEHPVTEFEELEDSSGEDADGCGSLEGESRGPRGGKGGFGTFLLPPVRTPEPSDGEWDSDVDGLVVGLGAEPHGIDNIQWHAEAMGPAGAGCPE
jgi:hypothetical protein